MINPELVIQNPRHRNWLRVAVYGEAPIPRDLTGPPGASKGKGKKKKEQPFINTRYDGGEDDPFRKKNVKKKTSK
jgi:hypothetical protein